MKVLIDAWKSPFCHAFGTTRSVFHQELRGNVSTTCEAPTPPTSRNFSANDRVDIRDNVLNLTLQRRCPHRETFLDRGRNPKPRRCSATHQLTLPPVLSRPTSTSVWNQRSREYGDSSENSHGSLGMRPCRRPGTATTGVRHLTELQTSTRALSEFRDSTFSMRVLPNPLFPGVECGPHNSCYTRAYCATTSFPTLELS